MINHPPTHLENLNRAQLRRDRLRDLGERALRMLTWATVIAGSAYVASLFAEMINLLNRSW